METVEISVVTGHSGDGKIKKQITGGFQGSETFLYDITRYHIDYDYRYQINQSGFIQIVHCQIPRECRKPKVNLHVNYGH